MRVGIDATELRPGAPGGVRRALFLLLDALERHAPDVEVSALAPGPVEAPRGVRVVQTGGPTTPRRWRKSRELRNALRRLDLFHSPVTATPAFDDVPMTATVHELPFMSAPVDGAVRVAIQNYWLTRALSRCRALVMPSHATLRQLLGAHPCARRKTHVVPHPAPPAPDSEQRTHDADTGAHPADQFVLGVTIHFILDAQTHRAAFVAVRFHAEAAKQSLHLPHVHQVGDVV